LPSIDVELRFSLEELQRLRDVLEQLRREREEKYRQALEEAWKLLEKIKEKKPRKKIIPVERPVLTTPEYVKWREVYEKLIEEEKYPEWILEELKKETELRYQTKKFVIEFPSVVIEEINNLKTDQRAVINVSHPDYFANTRVVLVNQNGSYSEDINLDKEHLTLSFSAQEERSIVDNHASINFEPGDYISTKGKKYRENITVAMSYYNFKNTVDTRAFVGSYESTNGSTQFALLPHAFINMSVTDAQGNRLKIDSDTVVKLAFPASDIASNEPSIPLWFYDKKLGYWLQEGTATRVNNQYIGTITHVETWGIMSKTSKGSIQVCVVDGNNKAISAADIRMKGSRWASNLIQTE